MNFFNFNGKILSGDANIIGPANRGLRYGDGIFETIKIKEGILILSDEHFHRFWKGLQFLQFEIPKLWSPEKFTEQILQLARKNNFTNARIRLNAFRSDGGLYDSKDHTPNYTIEALPLQEHTGVLNINGLQLCIYEDAQKSIDAFSNIKHNNYLPYFMGAIAAKKQRCNDAMILNSKGNICDSTMANIFLITGDKLCTPALTEGCIAGVMRKWLIEKIREAGYIVDEKAISKKDVEAADEIFLTNSVYNIRWVADVGNKKYKNEIVSKINTGLAKKYPEIFC